MLAEISKAKFLSILESSGGQLVYLLGKDDAAVTGASMAVDAGSTA